MATKERVQLSKEQIIGKTLDELRAEFPDQRIRVTSINGAPQFHTLDLQFGRLNVAVEGVEVLEPQEFTLPAEGEFPEQKVSVPRFGDMGPGRIVSYKYEW